LPEGEFLVIKGVHRCGRGGCVDMIVTPLPTAQGMQSDSVPLLAVEAADLERIARHAGATRVQIFGGYADQPYDRTESTDLVVVAEK
jgi:hypothetical protein